MKVYVELPQSLDVDRWAERYAAGLAPDLTPYGLHRMADDTTSVAFARPLAACRRVLDVARNRLQGHDLLPAVVGAVGSPVRRSADVVLTMDERTGVPAALAPSRVPVVSGVGWVERPADVWPAVGRIGHHALRRMTGVFTECPAMVDVLTRDLGLSQERVRFVRFGVDADYFGAQPYGLAVPGRVFSVGDDRMRDHRTLVAAVARVREQVPGVTLELATTLPVEVPSDLGVVHARRMDGAVRECYARASVVAVALQPTRVGSGLTVLVEAMASGRPVVVTANPGLEEYVADGLTGLLVPPGDVEAMAQAVRSLVLDPDRAAEMGRAARARVEKSFTSTHFAHDLRTAVRGFLEV